MEHPPYVGETIVGEAFVGSYTFEVIGYDPKTENLWVRDDENHTYTLAKTEWQHYKYLAPYPPTFYKLYTQTRGEFEIGHSNYFDSEDAMQAFNSDREAYKDVIAVVQYVPHILAQNTDFITTIPDAA